MGEWSVDKDGTMHETYQLLFLVGNDLVSQGEYDPGNAPDLGYRRTGVAYVCPNCATVWASAIVTDSSGRQMAFEVVAVPCANHPSTWYVPGSLLGGYRNDAYLRLLSSKALKREFILHHNWHRRGLPG